MKHYTISKLDRRHKGYQTFSHYISPVWSSSLTDKLRFFEWRTWCWDTWGPGLEREVVFELGKAIGLGLEPKWAWHLDKYGRRLYFKTEKELNWFNMRWLTDED
jgi:hypothetical protein